MEVNAEVIRERVARHNRLMKMIKNYHRSNEQTAKLERIKVNTMMEINLRFLRSSHNRNYKFPKNDLSEAGLNEQSSEEDENQFRHQSICDLFAQNNSFKNRSLSNKVISLDQSRRANSLEAERMNWQQERLLRLNAKSKQNMSLKQSFSLKKLRTSSESKEKNNIKQLGIDIYDMRKAPFEKESRENSKQTDNIKSIEKDQYKSPQKETAERNNNQVRKIINSGTLRLPDLKRMKTEGTANIQSVIGRKLNTESSESNIKIKGLAKYLKDVEDKNRESHRKKMMQILV